MISHIRRLRFIFKNGEMLDVDLVGTIYVVSCTRNPCYATSVGKAHDSKNGPLFCLNVSVRSEKAE